MNKVLPPSLTSYDLLKSLAVILMVCDHMGYFFFPEEMWFRTLGRLCLPIWFFLIGYAKTDEVPKSFWIGGGIVALSSLIAGQHLLPLNILFTMAFVRLYRDGFVRYGLGSAQALRGMFFILLFLSFPTSLLVEYGAMAMLIALIGFMARRREAVYKIIERKYVLMFVAASFFSLFIIQGVSMPALNNPQALVLLIGYVSIAVILWRFEPVAYSDANKFIAGSLIRMFQIMGRRSLEIYVMHIVAFRFTAMVLFPEKYVFWEWEFIHENVLAMFT